MTIKMEWTHRYCLLTCVSTLLSVVLTGTDVEDYPFAFVSTRVGRMVETFAGSPVVGLTYSMCHENDACRTYRSVVFVRTCKNEFTVSLSRRSVPYLYP